MEAAFTKFRMTIAIMATIVMGAAMFQAIAPADGASEPTHHICPPMC